MMREAAHSARMLHTTPVREFCCRVHAVPWLPPAGRAPVCWTRARRPPRAVGPVPRGRWRKDGGGNTERSPRRRKVGNTPSGGRCLRGREAPRTGVATSRNVTARHDTSDGSRSPCASSPNWPTFARLFAERASIGRISRAGDRCLSIQIRRDHVIAPTATTAACMRPLPIQHFERCSGNNSNRATPPLGVLHTHFADNCRLH